MTHAQSFNGGPAYAESLSGLPDVPPEINDAAVRQVCARARSAAEARQLLAMLGLQRDGELFTAEPGETTEPETLDDYPSQGIGRPRARAGTPCAAGCGRHLRPSGSYAESYPGTVKHAGRGLCAACRRRLAKGEA